MSRNSNEAGMLESSRLRESSAVAAAPKVPHASDTAQQGGEGQQKVRTPGTEVPRDPLPTETDETAAIRGWWARADTAWAMSDFPEYGSPEWDALDDSNPAKLAAMLSAAEKWRQL